MGNLLTCVKGKKLSKDSKNSKIDRIESINIKNKVQNETKIKAEDDKTNKVVDINSDNIVTETIRKSLIQVQEFASDQSAPLNSSPVKKDQSNNIQPLDVSEILLNETVENVQDVEEDASIEDTLDLIANEICDNSWIDNSKIDNPGIVLCVKKSSIDLRVQNNVEEKLNQDMRVEISNDSIHPCLSKDENTEKLELNISSTSLNPENVELPTLSDVMSIQSENLIEPRSNVLVQPYIQLEEAITEERRNAVVENNSNIKHETQETLKIVKIKNLNTDPCDSNNLVSKETGEIIGENIIDTAVCETDLLKPVINNEINSEKAGDCSINTTQKKKRRPKRNRSKRKDEKPVVNVK